MSDLSIVIVTYNSAGVIRRCLDSVFGQELAPYTLEVIIVDNASTDETKDIVLTYSSKIRVVENTENRGFAAAANEGASLAQSALLLFSNPDTYVEPGSLKKMLAFFPEHSEISIAGCRMLHENGTKQRSCWKKPNLATLIAEMVLPYDVSLKLVTEEPQQTSTVPSVSGACMLIKRSDFVNLHGFDTDFFMYYEDIDFCVRAQQAGLKTYYYP
ncbi:MAG: glycosyltransferase family 2 protein, partial [Ignavibacteriales bacterium]|nr:glycosyltransferase family 2 protein [Ignavibacteriales bacterium]